MLVSIESMIAKKLPSVAAAPLRAHIHGRFSSCFSTVIQRSPTGKQKPIRNPQGATSARDRSARGQSVSAIKR